MYYDTVKVIRIVLQKSKFSPCYLVQPSCTGYTSAYRGGVTPSVTSVGSLSGEESLPDVQECPSEGATTNRNNDASSGAPK